MRAHSIENNEERGKTYLLTGLVIGLLIGLIFSWKIMPVDYTEVSPDSLHEAYKERYRLMIALAYDANNDLGRAKDRLTLLKDEEPVNALVIQSQKAIDQGGSERDAQVLAQLAVALEKNGSGLIFSASESSSTPAEPTITVQVPAVSAQTGGDEANGQLAASFRLQHREIVCDPLLRDGLMQVMVENKSGEQLPGVELIVTWQGGSDRFYTGLNATNGAGYADFQMEPEKVYTLQVGETGEVVTELSAPECTAENGQAYWGSLWLRFAN
jgi:hypothetical protein